MKIVIVGLALVAATAGCSKTETPSGTGSTTPPASSPASNAVAVTLQQWKVTAPATAAAGQVTFNATNSGTIPHEMVVFKTTLAPDKLPLKNGDVDEDSSQLESPGEIEDIDPGKTKSATFPLTAGHYVLLCNVSGHYKAGMRTELNVT